MKDKFKSVLGLVFVFSLSLISSGCFQKNTVGSIQPELIANMNKINACAFQYKMESLSKYNGKDERLIHDMEIKTTIDYNKKIVFEDGTGFLEFESANSKEQVDVEVFTKRTENNLISAWRLGGDPWETVKEVNEEPINLPFFNMVNILFNSKENLKLNEKNDFYIVSGDVSYKELAPNIPFWTANGKLTKEPEKIEAKIFIDKNLMVPSKITLKFFDEKEDSDAFTFEYDILEYNSVDSIEIPKDLEI